MEPDRREKESPVKVRAGVGQDRKGRAEVRVRETAVVRARARDQEAGKQAPRGI